MDLVTTFEQIQENIAELERVRRSDGTDHAYFRDLIRRGRCFVPYLTPEGMAFAPSRFVGYAANTLAKHAANAGRDGKLTNPAIGRIFGGSNSADAELEAFYVAYCKRLGIDALARGARSYWLTPEVEYELEERDLASIESDPNRSATTKKALRDSRVGQGRYRASVLACWDSRCCLTGCEEPRLLIASHIKPWSKSTDKEKLDGFNGLLLTPHYDALFDRGFISFTNEGVMLVAKELSGKVRTALALDSSLRLSPEPEHVKYLEWHRRRWFLEKRN
ncbi:HNH endonuclease [Rhodoferax sp. OV413]|uniref:HNH endonuclease n=1 Tax=Rhodoferax sp. OV413 TaxID=1855285 RepID=UPI0008903188|nr:HNH endonuclease [Rhodoferax sp. OV413]SDP92998.1 HNH endonuclease [Rhodoferax sp. OV413]